MSLPDERCPCPITCRFDVMCHGRCNTTSTPARSEMIAQIIEIARQSGATDLDGGRAEKAFCFTSQEFDTFVKSLVTRMT